jgi:HCO3- transporter family
MRSGAAGASDDGSPTQHDTSSEDGGGDADTPPLFQFMTGIREDLAARLPLYKDDWGRPRNIFTVFNATCFAFVIQLIPALIFAELMDRETEGNLATAEV